MANTSTKPTIPKVCNRLCALSYMSNSFMANTPKQQESQQALFKTVSFCLAIFDQFWSSTAPARRFLAVLISCARPTAQFDDL